MKKPIGPDISVIQKISVAIIHERNVQKLLDNVLDILETELGCCAAPSRSCSATP